LSNLLRYRTYIVFHFVFSATDFLGDPSQAAQPFCICSLSADVKGKEVVPFNVGCKKVVSGRRMKTLSSQC